MEDKFVAVVGIVVILGVISWVLWRTFNAGRLRGMREAVLDLSRQCSFHYESKQEDPLPEKVTKALDYMKDALKRGSGVKGKTRLYLLGAGMLGDAMGEAAWQKGFYAGQNWTDPRDGEQRIDMPIEGWRTIRYLAHIGFKHQMPNYEAMLHFPFGTEEEALEAERAIEKLEFAIRHSEVDPEYSDSLSRNMLIWEQWPKEQRA
jgi:hypothetical protein